MPPSFYLPEKVGLVGELAIGYSVGVAVQLFVEFDAAPQQIADTIIAHLLVDDTHQLFELPGVILIECRAIL